ncbi:hypothetical protein [Agrobacterium rubi]|uniref:Uncharacterized protein n=1 Tax=Agrobacterium rubi TaxID=28099 RepID=A0ABX2IZM6_9HYPH|nr:hypothetical protein [Agrobacterium rubi]NTF35564.1 hypothetical protein [Agrobacterium rubi]
MPKPGRIAQSNRGSVQVAAKQTSVPLTFPAPTQGLVSTISMGAAAMGSASILENWFMTLTGARVRGGSVRRGRAADGGAIRSAFKYKYGGLEKMFMATNSGIYDMTAPAAPPATTAAAVSGMSSGDWCAFQQTNAGTSYLVCFNGTDARRLFNGVSWSTTPAITFADSTTMASLNYGWIFKNRQFLIKNASLDAYYLDLNAVGGAASVFPLGGVMKKGGSLLMGFSWSIESGDGLGDYCVFVSTEGEVAIYSGSNPGDAADFALKGVYQIGKPLGKNAQIKSGADVLVATIDGLTPISQIFQRDRQTLALVSQSRAIEREWKLAANAAPTGWSMTLWPEQNLVFVSFPENTVLPDTTFVFNVLNGKWSIVKNWRASAYQTLQGSLFFGSSGGYCWQGDISGADDGAPFAATYLSQFTAAGEFSQEKVASKGQMSFTAKTEPNVKLFARADYDMKRPPFAVVSVGNSASSEWDVGLWDVAKWDGISEAKHFKFKQNVRASGEMLALGCVVLSAGQFRLDVEVDFGILQMEGGEQSA